MNQMTEEETNKITNQLTGSWRLPINENNSISITLLSNANFFWTIAAYSTTEKAIQILTGSEMQGNWQVRATRKPPKIDKIRNPFNTEKAKESSVSSPSGPYLILNFTDLPKSMLNLRIKGWQVDLANWINNVLEVTRDGHYRILEFSSDKMQLKTPENKLEVWRKVGGAYD